MHRIQLIISLLLCSIISQAQSALQEQTEKWMKDNHIKLNNPTVPEGFIQFRDCKSNLNYKRVSGDSIFLFSQGGAIAEELETFKQSTREPNFNSLRYPYSIQRNGTVVVISFKLHKFIWRNDTLYLYDDFNSDANEAFLQIMKDYSAKIISEEAYKKQLKEFDQTKYPVYPKLKAIYFNEIFKNSSSYTFNKDQNFRKETVYLVKRDNEGRKEILEINLDTHSNGRYRFSSDLAIIEAVNCN